MERGTNDRGADDWTALVGAWRRFAQRAILVVESDRLEANREGLAPLRAVLDRERNGDGSDAA